REHSQVYLSGRWGRLLVQRGSIVGATELLVGATGALGGATGFHVGATGALVGATGPCRCDGVACGAIAKHVGAKGGHSLVRPRLSGASASRWRISPA